MNTLKGILFAPSTFKKMRQKSQKFSFRDPENIFAQFFLYPPPASEVPPKKKKATVVRGNFFLMGGLCTHMSQSSKPVHGQGTAYAKHPSCDNFHIIVSRRGPKNLGSPALFLDAIECQLAIPSGTTVPHTEES